MAISYVKVPLEGRHDQCEFVQRLALEILVEAGEVITGKNYVPVPHESRDVAKRNVIAWIKGEASDYALPFADCCDVAAGEHVNARYMQKRFLSYLDAGNAARVTTPKSRGPKYRAAPVSLDDVPNAGWRRVYRVAEGIKLFARSSAEASDWVQWGCGRVL